MQSSDTETCRKVSEFVERYLSDPDRMNSLIPSDFSLLFGGHLTGWESVLLGTHCLALVWRGASAADVARYATTRDVSLPFTGCEQQLFDLFLDNLNERIEDPDIVIRMVSALTGLQSNLFEAMKQDTGISPLDIPMSLGPDGSEQLVRDAFCKLAKKTEKGNHDGRTIPDHRIGIE